MDDESVIQSEKVKTRYKNKIIVVGMINVLAH